MLMILARLVRSESFWAVAKIRSPHTGPEVSVTSYDVYASLFGTIVIRHCSVPARPAELDGEVVILVEKGGGLDGAGAEAELRSALARRYHEKQSGNYNVPNLHNGSWGA